VDDPIELRPTTASYEEVLAGLLTSYEAGAARRENTAKAPWKIAERDAFLARLRGHGGTRLLEVGAGTGQDSAFFAAAGLDVVATDASAAMVAYCRRKGLDARVMQFLDLDFPPASFDAVYAMNCLLHVPDADLARVLRGLRDLLRPGGLGFIGAYGGRGTEGVATRDEHDPPRFFAWRTDEQIQRFARESFDIVDFHVVTVNDIGFQSLTVARPIH
jgi:SAM-dependent methyltransferase